MKFGESKRGLRTITYQFNNLLSYIARTVRISLASIYKFLLHDFASLARSATAVFLICVGGKRNDIWVDQVPGGEETRRETALPPQPPRGNRIDEAEEEETARWGRAVPAGRPRRVLDVPEASAMAGGGACQRSRKRDGSGREVGKKRSGGWRAARILGAFAPLNRARAIRSTNRAEG